MAGAEDCCGPEAPVGLLVGVDGTGPDICCGAVVGVEVTSGAGDEIAGVFIGNDGVGVTVCFCPNNANWVK